MPSFADHALALGRRLRRRRSTAISLRRVATGDATTGRPVHSGTLHTCPGQLLGRTIRENDAVRRYLAVPATSRSQLDAPVAAQELERDGTDVRKVNLSTDATLVPEQALPSTGWAVDKRTGLASRRLPLHGAINVLGHHASCRAVDNLVRRPGLASEPMVDTRGNRGILVAASHSSALPDADERGRLPPPNRLPLPRTAAGGNTGSMVLQA